MRQQDRSIITQNVIDRFYGELTEWIKREPRGPNLRWFTKDEAAMYDILYGRRTVWLEVFDEVERRSFEQIHSLGELKAKVPNAVISVFAVTVGMIPEAAMMADQQAGTTQDKRQCIDLGDCDQRGAIAGKLLAALLPDDPMAPMSAYRQSLLERYEAVKAYPLTVEDLRKGQLDLLGDEDESDDEA